MANELEDAKIEKTQDSVTITSNGSIQLTETHKVFQDDVMLGSYQYVVPIKPEDPTPKLITDAVNPPS